MSDDYTINDMLRDAEGSYEQHEFPVEQHFILADIAIPEVRRAPLHRRIRYGVASALRSLANKIERN